VHKGTFSFTPKIAFQMIWSRMPETFEEIKLKKLMKYHWDNWQNYPNYRHIKGKDLFVTGNVQDFKPKVNIWWKAPLMYRNIARYHLWTFSWLFESNWSKFLFTEINTTRDQQLKWEYRINWGYHLRFSKVTLCKKWVVKSNNRNVLSMEVKVICRMPCTCSVEFSCA